MNSQEEIYRFWEEKEYFKADPSNSKKPYSILMPPPNLTGELHLGHAMQHSILDALARFKRMQGYDVLLLPGVDHAGIQFEGTFNKLLAKEGLSKYKLGREEWLKRAWEFRDEVYKSFHNVWTVMGISADWDREVFALDEKIQKAVLEEFKIFWEQDLLYKGAYIVQWCPKCGTAIEDVEMEYQERKEKLYFVKYNLVDSDEYITIATARPETIFADVAIAIYPNHPKYSKFTGKKVVNPFTKKEIPVIEDKKVKTDFGTGALKITPGHDLLDYEIGRDNGLEIMHAVGKDGKMTDLAGDLSGLKAQEARVKSEEKLKELSALEKIEDYSHSVPVCERCKTTVEPLISEEWYVKMKPLAEKALKNISKVNFIPSNYLDIISKWLNEIHDWSISRTLWWGHRIPVWYCETCNPSHEVGKDKDMLISFEKPKEKCKNCQGSNWVQDEQVLDTWFSSGMWPFATLGWPGKTKELERYSPWNFEISAPEIRYLWIARMIMLSLWFTDKIPFENMFFHGMLRDLQGRKFSKSLGNGIDPNELRNEWGTDSLRMSLYTYSAPGRDGKTSKQVMGERCKNFRNFGTKLKNIYRFIVELKPEGAKSNLEISHEDDQEINKKLNETIKEVTKNLENFNFHLATENVYNFVWHEFADSYIEKTKKRRADAQPVLEHILTETLKLLHPFMPFTTEEIYQKMPQHKESIMIETWPH
ncbi:MAG: valine--tRNA ligase [Patescibacteria group bacterium]|nr:valine--tRNA ligase [Patescibacteria group bacterium]